MIKHHNKDVDIKEEDGDVVVVSDKMVVMKRVNFALLWVFVAVVVFIIGFFGFSFSVKAGSSAIVTSFGKVYAVYEDAGLHFRLPWPFGNIVTYDTRSQYLDSGYTETLTMDKKNVVLQTYAIWQVEDVEKFHSSVGSMTTAETYIDELIANEKNSVMGNYNFCALVSTVAEELNVTGISSDIETNVKEKALALYGISIKSVEIKRLALPDSNVQSVLEQMIADRQQYAAQLIAEGAANAEIIKATADAEAAAIIKAGNDTAVAIDIETAKEIAELEADAFDQNTELYKFMKALIALESSVDENTVFILSADDDPLGILTGIDLIASEDEGSGE